MANRIMPDGDVDITGRDYMNKVKEELEAISQGPIFTLENVTGVNVITADAVVSIPDYKDGMRFAFKPAANNTAGVTINIDGQGAKSVRDLEGNTLSANELIAGRLTEVIFLEGDDHFRVLTGIQGTSIDSKAVIVSNQQDNNTAGGTATAGSWQTYPLNTVRLNELSSEGAALASNEVTLPAGTYDFFAAVPFHQTQSSKIRLYNITDGTVVTTQAPAQVRATTANEIKTAQLCGRITITAPKVFRLEYRVSSTQSTNGLGVAANFSETEQYGTLYFQRPAEGGADGSDGIDGSAGIEFLFNSDTADSDPGGGQFKFNNAAIADVSEIYIDDVENRAAADVSALIQSWGNASTSNVQGRIAVQGIDDQSDYAEFYLDAVVVESGYSKLEVTYIEHNGTFTATQRYSILFIPKGDKGDKGDTGATGPNTGLDYQWNDATAGDPGAGYVRADNATFGNITSLAISDVDRNASNLEDVIQASDDSSSVKKAVVRLFQIDDRTKWMDFYLDSDWTDQTGYWTADVTPIGSGAAIDDDAIISVSFWRTGDAGGLQAGNNLSDVDDAATAAVNIGALQIANNLSDVGNVDTSRNNLLAEPQVVRLGSEVKTGSYTLALADGGKDIRSNVAGAHNITVPPNSTVPFPLNTVITGGQYGAGQSTFVPGSGVTIRSRGTRLKTAGQYARWELMKIGTNEWWLCGDLTA